MSDHYRGGVPLVEVTRSGFVESWHHGSVVVLEPSGAVIDAAGDPDAPIFPRSVNKPMQAVGMLRVGLRLPDPADLAIVCGSHWGYEIHAERVRALLRGAGLEETALRCPPALPTADEARVARLCAGGGPLPVYMCCSGKHAGMLLTCLAAGWPVEDYCDPNHPLQEALRTTVAQLTRHEVAAVGVDGCGAPVFAASLTGLATGFHTLVTAPPGSAERTVADAMRGNPEMVAGPGSPDTRLMAGVPGLLVKNGVEAVMAAAFPGGGAVAIKIDDGGHRALLPVLVAVLRRFARLGEASPLLDEFATAPVLGGGEIVGEVRAVW